MHGRLIYVVKQGDTLYSIAKKYDLTPEAILLFNHIQDPTAIYVGQVLYLTE